jgi:hypothetical protein
MAKTKLLILPAAFAVVAIAQQKPDDGSIGDRVPPKGRVVVMVTPLIQPITLDGLLRASSLVVDGTITSVQPAINMRENSKIPTVETRSIVAINSVLKGKVPGSSAIIMLTQIGGKYQEWDVSVAGDPVVKEGDRYILFLASDDLRPKERPNASGCPRYCVIGVWSGKVKVSGGAITFPSEAAAKLHELDGMKVRSFIDVVKERLAGLPASSDTLPIHPGARLP